MFRCNGRWSLPKWFDCEDGTRQLFSLIRMYLTLTFDIFISSERISQIIIEINSKVISEELIYYVWRIKLVELSIHCPTIHWRTQMSIFILSIRPHSSRIVCSRPTTLWFFPLFKWWHAQSLFEDVYLLYYSGIVWLLM